MARINVSNMITIVAGLVIMLTGIVLTARGIAGQKIAEAGIITMGMVMIVVGVLNTIRKREGVTKDEMTRKIADRSAAYSWVMTLLALLLIFWLNHFEVIEFTINAVISIVYVIMIATMIYFQKRYMKRGIE